MIPSNDYSGAFHIKQSYCTVPSCVRPIDSWSVHVHRPVHSQVEDLQVAEQSQPPET